MNNTSPSGLNIISCDTSTSAFYPCVRKYEMNHSSVNVSTIERFVTATNGASLLVCLAGAILVFAFRLQRKVVYRLALYQVLASLLLATIEVFQLLFINYAENPRVYGRVCIAIGWLLLYGLWMKLLFTTWLTLHLFCFGVLHKNLKRYEALYVVSSLLVPGVIGAVPLITGTYALDPTHTLCYINSVSYHHTAVTERLALWMVPAMVALLACTVAMVFLGASLTRQACNMTRYEPLADDNQFIKAIKQLIPLTAFPILSFIFMIPFLVFNVYSFISFPQMALTITAFMSTSLWSMTSGLTLIVHITVARCVLKKKHYLRAAAQAQFIEAVSE